MRNGLVIGKFMPLHTGHEYLIRFAAASVDFLHVVVCTTRDEPIPGDLRYNWVVEEFGGLSNVVVSRLQDLPTSPEEYDGSAEDFWRIWRTELERAQRQVVGDDVTHVFSSEDYGWRLADELGAEHVMVNKPRSIVPISGTLLRSNMMKHWSRLSRPAKAHFGYRVVVGGAESCGKTTLTARLAERFGTVWVPEYGREFYETIRGRPSYSCLPEDIPKIYRGHVASTEALAREAAWAMFIDTDPIITHLFSEFYFGSTPPEVLEGMKSYRADLTLVCAANVPFVQDGMRDLEHARSEFVARYVEILQRLGRRYVMIDSQDWAERERQAVAAVIDHSRVAIWEQRS